MNEEQKQKRREANKRYRDNMTEEQKQKQGDYQRDYRKKLNNKINDDNDNDIDFYYILIIIKKYNNI